MKRRPTSPIFPPARRASVRGVAMLEVLISLLIVAFGILGLFGMQAQASVAQMESYQRAQALVLVKDMAQRLEANRTNAADYLTGANDAGATAPGDCSTKTTTAARDLCEWGTLLQGAAELDSSNNKVGAMIGARGCISKPDPISKPNLYLVAVAWQGLRETGAPPVDCGKNAYSSEPARRAATVVVRIPVLS